LKLDIEKIRHAALGVKAALVPSWFPDEVKSLRRAFVSHPHSVGTLSGFRRYLPDLIVVSLVLNLLGLVLPLTLLQVYDRILPSTATDTLTALGIGIAAAVTLETVLRISRSAVTGWTSARFEHMAATRTLGSLLRQPLDEFERKGTGVHLETLNSIHTLKDFYAGQAFLSVFDLPFAVIYLLMTLLFGGWLVMVPIGLMVAFAIAGLVMGRKMMDAIRQRLTSDDQRANFIVEVLSGIHTVKALGMEAQMMRRHERLLENSAQAEFTVSELSAKSQSLALLFSHLTTILVVAFGSIAVIDGDMSTGVLAACSLLAGRCIQPMQAALDRWTRFQTARLAEERLCRLLENTTPFNATTLPQLDSISGSLRLEQAVLRFGDGPAILASIDFEIQAGELIGISGENGVGKSSLLTVMAGLTQPTSGRVLVDGCNLAGFDPVSVRAALAYIPQRPELFFGTILENITLFDPTRAAVAKAYARELGVDRFVARLPQGYDTKVGEGSSDSLPRGFRQLLSIVRALAQEPRIILFDEANSAVDGAGDQALRAVFERLKGKATIILMTSRPSMLSLSDRSFKLIDGRLVDAKAAAAAESRGAPLVQPVPLAQAAALQAAQGQTPQVPDDFDDRRSKMSSMALNFFSEVEQGSPFGRCLMPLLTAMRWNGELRHLAEALPHFNNTLDIVAFRNVMGHLGYGNESVQLKGQAVDSRVLPCLFVDCNGTPMVLTSIEARGVVALDMANGEDQILPSSRIYGTAYFFTALDPTTRQSAPGQWFRKIVARFYGLVWALLGQSLIINLLSLGVPLFTMSVYDKVIGTGDIAMLVAFLCGVLIVIAGDEVLRELRAKASAYVGARISYIVTTSVFERTLLLPVGLTERATIGSQIARFKDLESFRDFFGGGIAAMLIDLPFVMIYLIVLILLGGPIVLVPVVTLMIFALIVIAAQPIVRRRVSNSARSVTRRQEFVVETLLKMRSIRCAGMEAAWWGRFNDICAQAAMAGYESSLLTGVLASVSQAMVVLSGMGTMIVGVQLVLAGTMTAGALIASMVLVWRILAAMQTGFSLVQRVEQTRSSIRQLESLASFRTEGDSQSQGGSTLALRGAVTFARVSLRYTNDADPALLGVSFEAKPGEVIAIVGSDGAGKSTVLKLIAGLYAPQAGNVMIDDLDIRQIDPIELRKTIGYAPQVPHLFFGTIAQNLRLAQPTASDADLRQALTLAGVWDEVAGLERGLGTRVGDAATNRISTSLAQGISLARAYLKKSQILLLDEPVTGLDFEGDRCFRKFVEAMRGKTTIFIVTHRPSHLSLADQIVVLEKGAVRAVGPADEIRSKLA
jgi:ATP-binding cassette subfamily B protein